MSVPETVNKSVNVLITTISVVVSAISPSGLDTWTIQLTLPKDDYIIAGTTRGTTRLIGGIHLLVHHKSDQQVQQRPRLPHMLLYDTTVSYNIESKRFSGDINNISSSRGGSKIHICNFVNSVCSN